jgi:hypothetical protein
MKEELKQKMISVIGTHSNALIESIAEKCAQVAVDFIEIRNQALSMSGVSGSVADAIGRKCPFCGEPCVECSHKATDR